MAERQADRYRAGGDVEISPSILSADFARLGEQIAEAEAAGAALLHLDVMDGHFVPNITFGPMIVEAVNRLTPAFLDCHLMISEPARYADRFIDAGADRLIVHIETLPDPRPLLAHIRGRGCQAGLTLNPETPFEAVEPYLGEVDLLLVMSVRPGFGGQKFMPEALPRVTRAAELRRENGWGWPIEIDGGIDPATAPSAAAAGADILVAGNSIFRQGSIAGAMAALRRGLAGRSS